MRGARPCSSKRVSRSPAAAAWPGTRGRRPRIAADVGREVLGGRVGEVVEEPGPDQGAERGLAELDGACDEVDRGDSVLPVGADVIADDERAVGPADQHRPLEAQLVDDRGQVVGP